MSTSLRQSDTLSTELVYTGATVTTEQQSLTTELELAFALSSDSMAQRYSNFVSPAPGNQLEKNHDGGLFVPPQEEPDFLALYILGRN